MRSKPRKRAVAPAIYRRSWRPCSTAKTRARARTPPRFRQPSCALPSRSIDWGQDSMTITITAFERSPDGGKGLARDTRVRWALEEVGQPYEVRLVSFRAMKEPAHLALHPFGQIPTYEEGDLAL